MKKMMVRMYNYNSSNIDEMETRAELLFDILKVDKPSMFENDSIIFCFHEVGQKGCIPGYMLQLKSERDAWVQNETLTELINDENIHWISIYICLTNRIITTRREDIR